MINVAGTIRRAYLFPADRPTAFTYYGDLGRLLTYLPHIQLIHDYGNGQFRVLYETAELSTYHIRIFADVQATLDPNDWIMRVAPLTGTLREPPKSGLNWSTAHGSFTSEHFFHEAGDDTQIEYVLRLRAELPTPLGLRLMPSRAVDAIAENIVQRRMREISDGFIERSIQAFPDWFTGAERERTDID
jgi:hypothetical protein